MDAQVATEMLQLFAGLRGLIKDVPIRIAIQCASSNGPVGEDPIVAVVARDIYMYGSQALRNFSYLFRARKSIPSRVVSFRQPHAVGSTIVSA